jgi:hypothetical protein
MVDAFGIRYIALRLYTIGESAYGGFLDVACPTQTPSRSHFWQRNQEPCSKLSQCCPKVWDNFPELNLERP